MLNACHDSTPWHMFNWMSLLWSPLPYITHSDRSYVSDMCACLSARESKSLHRHCCLDVYPRQKSKPPVINLLNPQHPNTLWPQPCGSVQGIHTAQKSNNSGVKVSEIWFFEPSRETFHTVAHRQRPPEFLPQVQSIPRRKGTFPSRSCETQIKKICSFDHPRRCKVRCLLRGNTTFALFDPGN